MFLKRTDRIMILIGEKNKNLEYWHGILSQQNNGLGRVTINNNDFLQIRVSVLNNVRREAFFNGTMDNNDINYQLIRVNSDCNVFRKSCTQKNKRL